MESRNHGSLEEYSRSFISFVSKNVSHSAVNVANGQWQRLPGVLAVPVCDLQTWKRNWEIYRGHIRGRSAPCNASPCCTEEELQAWMEHEECVLKEGGLYCTAEIKKDEDDKSKEETGQPPAEPIVEKPIVEKPIVQKPRGMPPRPNTIIKG
jgi:hypothetical protein